MPITSSLYLSTSSTINQPINYSTNNTNSNWSSTTWIIDWDNIFRGHTGLCKVTFSMSSNKGPIPNNWNDSNGSINITGFSSPYSLNSGNGFALSALNRNQWVDIGGTTAQPILSYVYYYQASNVSNTSPPTISIPQGKLPLTINMFDNTGTTLISSFPPYSIQFFFEWISQEEIKKYHQ